MSRILKVIVYASVVNILILAASAGLRVSAKTTPTPTMITPPAITITESSLEVTPTQVVMQVNDLGKTYTFNLKNNTDTSLVLVLSEASVTQNEDGTVSASAQAATKTYLEISKTLVNLSARGTATASVRTKITSIEASTSLPALKLQQQGATSGYAIYIPFVMQPTTGKLSMNTNLEVNADGFTFIPELKISGSVDNNGDKFFTPTGTVVVLKNGEKLTEQPITNQLSGILFPAKEKAFEIDWTIPDNGFESAGEYIIETRIGNDLSDKVTVSRINFVYIPKQLLYLAGGVIGGLIVLTLIINIIKAIVRKTKKTAV